MIPRKKKFQENILFGQIWGYIYNIYINIYREKGCYTGINFSTYIFFYLRKERSN